MHREWPNRKCGLRPFDYFANMQTVAGIAPGIVMEPVRLLELEAAFGYSGSDVDYLCNISTSRNFLYFETPKVGCSTIKRTLQLLELSSATELCRDVHDKRRSTLKGAISSGLSFQDLFESRKLFRFTLVRNPYSRILSCYLEKIVADPDERRRHQRLLGFTQAEPVSFQQFLLAIWRIPDRDRDMHWRSQACLINDSRVGYDCIGRFERFRKDFAQILRKIGCDIDESAICDVSPHKTNAADRLREFFGEGERQLVAGMYRADFERYGYPPELPVER